VLAVAILLCIVARAASAQPPGTNLSWDDCNASVNGGLNQTSSCLSNTEASKLLYGSYVLPADADALAGNYITLDIQTDSATLPCWWNFTALPRTAGNGYGVNFTTPCANAFDYWGSIGAVAGGPAAFLFPNAATPRMRVKAVVAIPADKAQPVPASVGEIYSFTFQLRHDATVGSCTGCLTSACFLLKLIRITQVGFPYFELSNASSRNFVLWQGGTIAPPGCPLALPVANKTWGSVKALYR
jgi:hypothetical protein